ncbi:MAG TPA: hypothetical protein VIF62_35030 [Labilithrix sp.]
MSLRALLSIALLVPAVFLERAAVLGQRVILPMYLARSERTFDSVSKLFLVSYWATMLAGPLGGATAIAIGPRWAATIGAAIAATGATVIALGASASFGTVVTGIGAGMAAPCVYAAAAETIEREDGASPRRFAFATAAVLALFVAMHAAGLGAPMLAGLLTSSAGAKLTFALVAAMLGASALVLGGSALVAPPAATDASAPPGAAPYREAAPAPPASNATRAVGPALATIVVAQAIYSMAATLAYPRRIETLSTATMATLWSIAPAIGLVTCLVALVLWSFAAATRRPWIPLATAPVGLLLVALGIVALAANESFAIAAFGSVLGAAGQAIAGPVLVAYSALAVPGRMRALAVSGCLLAASVAGAVALPAREVQAHAAVSIVVAIVAIGAGACGIARARRLHALFTPA